MSGEPGPDGDLERGLGLYSAVTISMGAMIGSGIFVLPALGYKEAGPAVVFAYVLAGLIVLPAALSKAEMATAMPESGGTYIFIDRALGPLFGTVAGLGAWFSLVFKSAFALVGLGAYLLLVAPVPVEAMTFVALALAALIVALNVIGTEQSGQLQAVIVTGVVVMLAAYVLNGGFELDPSRFRPLAPEGTGGIFTAAAFVFVSYAGVTKIASVAEEIEDPGRNLPRAMLLSMGIMMVLYTLVVAVVVGLTDVDTLLHSGPDGGVSLTPMASGAGSLFGGFGTLIISIVAVFALTSMANAGVLASSRFPLAMSRDSLLPRPLSHIDRRFKTPRTAILVTGGLLVALIAFVPVVDLAKLASAFQILVFALINVAVVALRESDVEFYQPSFIAPGYPYVQVFGVLGCLGLLTRMGAIPLIGAVGISLGGVLWYLVYGRSRTDRVGTLRLLYDRMRGRRMGRAGEPQVEPDRE